MSEPFLIGDAMTGGYGKGPDILHDCTIAVNKGEIAVIVGPNGAGKSTAMKAVFGMLNLRKGQVRLNGEDITGLSPQDRVARGMGFVLKDRRSGQPRFRATRNDLVFGANAQLRAIADVYAARDGQARFVADFVKAWTKVMMLDRYDVKGHRRQGPMAA